MPDSPHSTAHEVAVYRTLKIDRWVSSTQVANEAGMVPRTARHHLLRLVRIGIAETANVYPIRYRLLAKSERLEKAAAVLGQEYRGSEALSVHDAWSRR